LSPLNSKFSKIMGAIDGSEYSFKAAEYALGATKSFGAQLNAVTVTYTPELPPVTQENNLPGSKAMRNTINDDARIKEQNIQLKTELINGYR
jgi:nucleotide-binding universal stress UspA family protein